MDLFQILSDPTRREIIELLVASERTVGEIAERFPISRPAVAKHLAALEQAGLLVSEKRGREKWCRVEPGPLAEVAEWLRRIGGAAVHAGGEPGEGDAADTRPRRRGGSGEPWKVW